MDGVLLWSKVQEALDAATNAQELAELLTSIGTYLSDWNCATGMPVSFPHQIPYNYSTGMFYYVSTIASGSASNYIPSGASYTGAASTTVATGTVNVGDIFIFDGTVWIHRKMSELLGDVVRVNKVQSFTNAQKTQGRANIGAFGAEPYVEGGTYVEGIFYYVPEE